MIIKLDTDLVLPIAVAILAITLTIGNQTLIPKSSIDQLVEENDTLFIEISQANHEISDLSKELESYHTTQESLESLGATEKQAKDVIKAAEVYNLNPKS